jgi:hypothetical protein
MSTIHTMCPSCRTAVDLEPAQVLLAVPDVPGATGSYVFFCPSCGDPASKPAGRTEIQLLTVAGVTRPPAPAAPVDEESRLHGPPFTPDDVLDLHLLLAGPDWFSRVQGLAEARPSRTG